MQTVSESGQDCFESFLLVKSTVCAHANEDIESATQVFYRHPFVLNHSL